MKKRLKMLLIIIISMLLISFSVNSNAASVGMTLNSSSKLKAGNTVEVILRISSIDAGNGIDALVATLDYDKNIFEEVKQDSFTGMNGWNTNIYSTDTQMFTMTKSSKVNTSSDVLKITLKAKSAVNVNSTEIKLKDITASGGAVETGGTGDILIQDIKVNIVKETTTIQTPTNVITDEKLPQTGENVGIILAIVVVTIVAVVAFIKYKNIPVIK